MADDSERLRAVAEACRALGMTVGALKVGDIEVRLALPWGAEPKDTPRRRAKREIDSTTSPEMQALRDASMKQFGRVLPDEKLRAMKGALLGLS
jgi:hypothetical protein